MASLLSLETEGYDEGFRFYHYTHKVYTVDLLELTSFLNKALIINIIIITKDQMTTYIKIGLLQR